MPRVQGAPKTIQYGATTSARAQNVKRAVPTWYRSRTGDRPARYAAVALAASTFTNTHGAPQKTTMPRPTTISALERASTRIHLRLRNARPVVIAVSVQPPQNRASARRR